MRIIVTGTKRIQFPAAPESVKFSSAATFAEYNILDYGRVAVPNGEELGIFSWDGILPGKARKNEPWVDEWTDPKEIETQLSWYRKNKSRLKLLITGTPINHYVYLKSYEMEYSGAYGDYTYSIEFIDAKLVEVTTSQAPVEVPIQEPKREVPESSGDYVVQKEDCLWDIAQKKYGSGTSWRKIYDANKNVIESTAKKYGKSSSQDGWWIYPGTHLTIP